MGNVAVNKGGAIYNQSAVISLEASDRDIVFYNNVASNTYNDVYNSGGTLNICASTGKSISFNGSIIGLNGTININSNTNVSGGQYVFNNLIASNTINIYNGATMFET